MKREHDVRKAWASVNEDGGYDAGPWAESRIIRHGAIEKKGRNTEVRNFEDEDDVVIQMKLRK